MAGRVAAAAAAASAGLGLVGLAAAAPECNISAMAPEPRICEGGDGLFLPVGGEEDWPKWQQAIVWFVLLCYSFLGVALFADAFMAAIEVITSKTVVRMIGTQSVMVRVWNPTVANLSLMALGSSAPEIILSIVEIVGNNFYSGDLGPSTIVGSASFNLFVIIGICVSAISSTEFRVIERYNVYKVTACNSLFAYLWLLVILGSFGTSPDLVEVWEGVLTFVFFPVMLLLAYMADVGFFDSGKTTGEPRDEPTLTELPEFSLNDTYVHLARIAGERGISLREMAPQVAADQITSEQIGKMYFSRAKYRHNALRAMTGKKEIIPDRVHTESRLEEMFTHPVAVQGERSVGFKFVQHIVLENCGTVELIVKKSPDLVDTPLSVSYETVEGDAKPGEDYVHVRKRLHMPANVMEKTVPITIIDDDVEEEDEMFTVRLFDLRCSNDPTVTLSPMHSVAHVLIIDDDRPGKISMAQQKIEIQEGHGAAKMVLVRQGGGKGTIRVQYATKDGSAIADKDYLAVSGTVEFHDGELEKVVEIEIIDDQLYEKEEVFTFQLMNPTGGSTELGSYDHTDVHILSDDKITTLVDKVTKLLNINYHRFQLGQESWADQFREALFWEEDTGLGGKLFHVVLLPWSLVTATIPPTLFCNGWLAFVWALGYIGIVTALIGDLASLFGCVVGLSDSVTAITFVALGTSLPDTFASRTAALSDKTADNAVGNVTGSNAVNVYLGLGLPWMIASVYWRIVGPTCEWQEKYPGAVQDYPNGGFYVKAGPLVFSVGIFAGLALLCFMLLFARRVTVGGELGGPKAILVSLTLVLFWLIFVVLSSLKFEGNLD